MRVGVLACTRVCDRHCVNAHVRVTIGQEVELVVEVINFVRRISGFFQVGRHIFSLSDEELDLRAKVRDMKDEQSHISMMDEFARYMKLQRQIDKLMAQVKDSGKIFVMFECLGKDVLPLIFLM